MKVSLSIFLFVISLMNFSKEAYSSGYYSQCCCNDDGSQCLGGDRQHCCSHGEHPWAITCAMDCQGVDMRGDISTDPNPCGSDKTSSGDCGQPENFVRKKYFEQKKKFED